MPRQCGRGLLSCQWIVSSTIWIVHTPNNPHNPIASCYAKLVNADLDTLGWAAGLPMGAEVGRSGTGDGGMQLLGSEDSSHRDPLGYGEDGCKVLSFFGEEFARDPWPMLRRLRADGGVHRVRTADGPPAWLVTRGDGVRAGLLDTRLSTNLVHARGGDYRGFAVPTPFDIFQTSDAEGLGVLRHAITSELSPRRLGEWASVAAKLVEPQFAKLRGTGEINFVEQVVVPLPAAMLTRMLGLPAACCDQLLWWARSTLVPGAAVRSRDTLGVMAEIIGSAINYGRRGGDDTMLVRLTNSPDLSSGAIAGLLFYLLFVWYEILVDLISGAVWALCTRPAQLEVVRTAQDRHVAVDELTRWLSPQVMASPRFATVDLEILGHPVAAGETVLLCLAAANRDPAFFADPDELDVERNPNPHLGFGAGAHACVGTGLVRPTVAAVLDVVYREWPTLRLIGDESEVRWRDGFRHRGPLAMAVATR